jgi:N-acetylglutamate synthase-like GNAT family acetyltransferase
MQPVSRPKIVDITQNRKYERFLYRCLAPMPFRKHRNRQKYLARAFQKGFHKKILILNNTVVGSIEYAPAEAAGYPIKGRKMIVMNCIWVLRKAKGHSFGKLLVQNMVESEPNASGFATIALENHPSPWFRRRHIERLGFKPEDSVEVVNKRKHVGHVFTVYLMWMPRSEKAEPPTWDKQRLLEGENFCIAHPLYHPLTWEGDLLETR